MDSPQWSVAEVVRSQARERPDQPAITTRDEVISWRELELRANKVAAGLAAGGVEPGERVAFVGKSSPAYFELFPTKAPRSPGSTPPAAGPAATLLARSS